MHDSGIYFNLEDFYPASKPKCGRPTEELINFNAIYSNSTAPAYINHSINQLAKTQYKKGK